MKKKLFAIILSFAMVVTMMPAMALTAFAETPETNELQTQPEKAYMQEKRPEGPDYSEERTELTQEELNRLGIHVNEKVYEITSRTRRISAGTYTITQNVQNWHDAYINDNVKIILPDNLTLTFNYGLQMRSSKSLEITTPENSNHNGTLVAYGYKKRPGIGGWGNYLGTGFLTINSGNIKASSRMNGAGIDPEALTINGGTVEATGARNCAGIGGNDGNFGVHKIEINGGIVKATGGENGAGIGGGNRMGGRTVIINGGTVNATGGANGAGIGGGAFANAVFDPNYDSITINHGEVTATGGNNASGIGGGIGGNGGNVTIKNGNVTATGGNNASGIGGGERGNGGNVRIEGGDVTVTGGNNGAGIGGGIRGAGGSVTINGGKVQVQDPSHHNSMAFGAGNNNNNHGQFNVGNSCHTITWDGKQISNYNWQNGNVTVDFTKHLLRQAYPLVPAKIDEHGNVIPGTKAYYECQCGHFFEKYENGVLSDEIRNLEYWKRHDGRIDRTYVKVVFIGSNNHFVKRINVITGERIPADQIPNPGSSTAEGLCGWFYTKDGQTYNWNPEQQITNDMTIFAMSMTPEKYSKRPDKLSIGENTVDLCGIYTVNGTVNNSHRLEVRESAAIILQEGCKLNLAQGIHLKKGCSLLIMGTGTLIVNGTYGFEGENRAGIGGNARESCGNLTIESGTLTVIGRLHAAAIGGGRGGNGGNITINGGTVTATGALGGRPATGIGGGTDGDGGNITINGGNVTANGTMHGSGIGGGFYGNGGKITINGGNVTAKGGDAGGSGIGGGRWGNGGTVEIKGGYVVATAGNDADAAIGRGNSGKLSGSFNLASNMTLWGLNGGRMSIIPNPTAPILDRIRKVIISDKSFDGFDVKVKTTRDLGGLRAYHATISAEPEELVNEISYSWNGRTYYAYGRRITSLTRINHFYIRITAENNQAYYYEYKNDNVTKFIPDDDWDDESTLQDPVSPVDPATPISPVTPTDSTTETSDEPEVKPIVVATTAVKGLTAYKKALKVTWTAKKNVDGYVIQYSTNKNFKNAKRIVVTNAKSKSKKITKLKAKTKYYVRIRCYNKNENGKKEYSKWSTAKSAKTK